MPLPEILNVCDLEEVLAELGHAADREHRQGACRGGPSRVVRPTARGRPWRIPRAALLEAWPRACAAAPPARPRDSAAPWRPSSTGGRAFFFLKKKKKKAARRAEAERQVAARAAAEELRQEREAAQLGARPRLGAARREAARARSWRPPTASFSAAVPAGRRAPLGPGWDERPEARGFLARWPNGRMGGRPRWWLPPPASSRPCAPRRPSLRRSPARSPTTATCSRPTARPGLALAVGRRGRRRRRLRRTPGSPAPAARGVWPSGSGRARSASARSSPEAAGPRFMRHPTAPRARAPRAAASARVPVPVIRSLSRPAARFAPRAGRVVVERPGVRSVHLEVGHGALGRIGVPAGERQRAAARRTAPLPGQRHRVGTERLRGRRRARDDRVGTWTWLETESSNPSWSATPKPSL